MQKIINLLPIFFIGKGETNLLKMTNNAQVVPKVAYQRFL